MGQGQLGVLHTDSSFVGSAPSLPSIPGEDVRLHQIARQIQQLRMKEDAFAQRFGFNSIESMIESIRNLLQQNPADMAVLQRFSSGNLQKYLNKFKQINNSMLMNQPIRLILKGDSKKLDALFKAHGGNSTIKWSMSSPEMLILTQWDTKLIKDYTNKLTGKSFHTVGTGSDSTDTLINFLTSEANNAIHVEIGNKRESIDQFIINNAVSPFELKPSEFLRIVQSNPTLANDLKTRIQNFIDNDLCAGATGPMKDAVKTVMQSFDTIESYAFFMGGKGWSTHALGAFGELQTSILFQYFANSAMNKTLATTLASIIGNHLNDYKQQLHTDIELFKAFGIQVKNYGGTYDYRNRQEKTVEVRLHPTEIGFLGANEGIVDYIVNSYFNTSIDEYPESDLQAFFEAHASELLNLDLNPEIPDQVCFYMIGSNFIPGSVLLDQAFLEVTLKVETYMSGKKGHPDDYYLKPKEWHNKFTKWWKSTSLPPEAGEFEPTGDNTIGYWDRYVSIRTRFTYSALFGGAYKLF